MNDRSPAPLEFGDFRVDPRKRVLSRRNGEAIALTPKQFDTLLYLVENAGEVLEKDRMMAAIWPGMVVEENNLNQAISHLRRILGDDGAEHRYILTVPRRGYRFVAEMKAQADPGDAGLASDVRPVPPKPHRMRLAAAGGALSVLAVLAIVAWRAPSTDNIPANRKSIAVLPFTNFSGAREDEFFSDGITEDLVTQLAQISELKVISRTSILAYRGSKKPLREIARELGVAHILQGSVRRSETRFRISAQLIDPAVEGHLWARSYDRDIKDLLAVQSEVTTEIAAALKTRLLEPEKERLDKRGRSNAEAYMLYRRGAHLMTPSVHLTPGPDNATESLQRAREFFERVIAMDPASPLGYAGLARYYYSLTLWRGMARDTAFARAEELAQRALAADERSVEANLILAAIYSQGFWNWKKAEFHAKRAVELSPGDAEVWDGYRGSVLMPTGRLDEALAAQKRAVSLDPMNSDMAFRVALTLGHMRRCDEAIKQARFNLELDPRYWINHVAIARCHELNGAFSDAIAMYRKMDRPWLPGHALDQLQAVVDSPAGKADPKLYWRARLAWGRKYGETAQDQHYFTAALAAQAGEKDEAFRYLNRAIDLQERDVVALKVEPQFDPIRNDPRFAAALKRLNLN